MSEVIVLESFFDDAYKQLETAPTLVALVRNLDVTRILLTLTDAWDDHLSNAAKRGIFSVSERLVLGVSAILGHVFVAQDFMFGQWARR